MFSKVLKAFSEPCLKSFMGSNLVEMVDIYPQKRLMFCSHSLAFCKTVHFTPFPNARITFRFALDVAGVMHAHARRAVA